MSRTLPNVYFSGLLQGGVITCLGLFRSGWVCLLAKRHMVGWLSALALHPSSLLPPLPLAATAVVYTTQPRLPTLAAVRCWPNAKAVFLIPFPFNPHFPIVTCSLNRNWVFCWLSQSQLYQQDKLCNATFSKFIFTSIVGLHPILMPHLYWGGIVILDVGVCLFCGIRMLCMKRLLFIISFIKCVFAGAGIFWLSPSRVLTFDTLFNGLMHCLIRWPAGQLWMQLPFNHVPFWTQKQEYCTPS